MDRSDVVEAARRRRWSLEEKRSVVELSLDPECTVSEVAACFDILPAQIYAWRRELREAAEDAGCEEGPMFLPAIVQPTAVPTPVMPTEACLNVARLLPDAMVQLVLEVRGVPVTVAHGASAALVASVIAALQGAR